MRGTCIGCDEQKSLKKIFRNGFGFCYTCFALVEDGVVRWCDWTSFVEPAGFCLGTCKGQSIFSKRYNEETGQVCPTYYRIKRLAKMGFLKHSRLAQCDYNYYFKKRK